jgi:putative multiple sugar transport system substrate-binding protein
MEEEQSMRTKKFAAAAIACVVFSGMALSACSDDTGTPAASTASTSATAPAGFAADATIGVSLPQKTSENWVRAEDMFNEGLATAGFNKIVQFADNGASEQQSQIAAMINSHAKVIVIGAIDGAALGTQLEEAKADGAYIIAYDRLLTKTPNVDFYIAYDPFRVGELQGQALVEGLTAKGCNPCNIELIAGDAGDANSIPFFEGGMSIIQPKIDSGAYVVVSGQTKFTQVATDGWLEQNVLNRFDTLLAANYSATKVLDGVLSPNDTLARAALTSIQSAGMPGIIITGQDSEKQSIPLIFSGEQYSTINKDTGNLVNTVLAAIKDLQQGKAPVPNAEADNGTIKVPTIYLEPKIVTAKNICTAYDNDPVIKPLVVASGKC